MLFFINKFRWLIRQYKCLINEMVNNLADNINTKKNIIILYDPLLVKDSKGE